MNTHTGRLVVVILALAVGRLGGQTTAFFETGLAAGSGRDARGLEVSWQTGVLRSGTSGRAVGAGFLVTSTLDGGRQSLGLLPRYRHPFGPRLGVDLSTGPVLLLRRGQTSQMGGTAEVSIGWLDDVTLTGRVDLSDRTTWHGGLKLGTRQAGDGLTAEAIGLAAYCLVKMIDRALHAVAHPWSWDFGLH